MGERQKEQDQGLLGNTVPGNSTRPPSTATACGWSDQDDDGIYRTGCGKEFAPDDGSVDWIHYCFNCGERREDAPSPNPFPLTVRERLDSLKSSVETLERAAKP